MAKALQGAGQSCDCLGYDWYQDYDCSSSCVKDVSNVHALNVLTYTEEKQQQQQQQQQLTKGAKQAWRRQMVLSDSMLSAVTAVSRWRFILAVAAEK